MVPQSLQYTNVNVKLDQLIDTRSYLQLLPNIYSCSSACHKGNIDDDANLKILK